MFNKFSWIEKIWGFHLLIEKNLHRFLETWESLFFGVIHRRRRSLECTVWRITSSAVLLVYLPERWEEKSRLFALKGANSIFKHSQRQICTYCFCKTGSNLILYRCWHHNGNKPVKTKCEPVLVKDWKKKPLYLKSLLTSFSDVWGFTKEKSFTTKRLWREGNSNSILEVTGNNTVLWLSPSKGQLE